MNHADIDYCGVVQLLDWLLANGELEEREHQDLQKRLRRQMGAGIILISEREKKRWLFQKRCGIVCAAKEGAE